MPQYLHTSPDGTTTEVFAVNAAGAMREMGFKGTVKLIEMTGLSGRADETVHTDEYWEDVSRRIGEQPPSTEYDQSTGITYDRRGNRTSGGGFSYFGIDLDPGEGTGLPGNVSGAVKGVTDWIGDKLTDGVQNDIADPVIAAWDKTEKLASVVWSGVEQADDMTYAATKKTAGVIYAGLEKGYEGVLDAGGALAGTVANVDLDPGEGKGLPGNFAAGFAAGMSTFWEGTMDGIEFAGDFGEAVVETGGEVVEEIPDIVGSAVEAVSLGVRLVGTELWEFFSDGSKKFISVAGEAAEKVGDVAGGAADVVGGAVKAAKSGDFDPGEGKGLPGDWDDNLVGAVKDSGMTWLLVALMMAPNREKD